MRLFPSTARRERCTSASFSRRSSAVAGQAYDPPSPLAARPKTSGRSATKILSTRKKKKVHPIDLRDLESELELLPDPLQPSLAQLAGFAPLVSPRGFTIAVSILHALDLPNPCQIRSCHHPLQPCALVSINDGAVQSFPASRHAKNYTSWGKLAQVSHHVDAAAAAQLYVLRVQVDATCTRQATEPATVIIGEVDELVLSAESPREFSQFYTVFRYHALGGRVIKYFAGKLKLAISIQSDPENISASKEIEATVRDPVPSAASPTTPPKLLAGRPLFLPANFGDALQLKRQQLKATIVPEAANPPCLKPVDDSGEVRELLQSLRAQARDHMINIEDVNLLDSVGDGVHASVRQAELKRPNGDIISVAMKEFRYAHAESGASPPLAVLQAFQQEYAMLRFVTSESQARDVDNPTTVRLIGITVAPRLAIFTDFCRGGSLAKCLDSGTWDQVSMRTKLDLARQVASGLALCHALGVVHRDIKAHNIMVDGLDVPHPTIKIGDFGSAVLRRAPDPLLHEEVGSSGYTAPEIFQSCGYDQRADIWSMGVVLWELLCTSGSGKLQNPFVGICCDDVIRIADVGERPVVPPNSLPKWCESLLHRCWAADPEQRPTASEIASQFLAASSCGTS